MVFFIGFFIALQTGWKLSSDHRIFYHMIFMGMLFISMLGHIVLGKKSKEKGDNADLK